MFLVLLVLEDYHSSNKKNNMKKFMQVSKALFALSVLGVVCFSSIFPSCGVSTANLSDVKVCSSLNGSECSGDAASFPGDVPVIYCTANIKNAPAKTKVTFDWKHGSESMGKAEVETESGVVNSTFKPNSALESGKYSVVVKIATDNATPITKEYTIE
jgi:hypothetical protein